MALVQLSQIRGHGAQVEVLRRICAAAQPAHAYLFQGPDGVGKQTVAWALAARLACLQADGRDDACGRCRSCRALKRGNHADISLLSRDGASIRINQVRDAGRRLRFDPVIGRCKVLIIEEADRLREEAANALLKTLEEPPPRTHFVLLTARPQLLLRTIISRSQVVRFSSLAPEEICAILEAEGRDAGAARVAAALAEGSLARARPLCQPDWLEAVDEVVRFTLALGETPACHVPAFVSAFTSRWNQLEALGAEEAAEVDAPTSSVAEARALARGQPIPKKRKRAKPAKRGPARLDREALSWAVDAVRLVLRDAMLVASGIDAEDLPHARYAVELRALVARSDARSVVKAIEACERLERRYVYNPNTRLALESVLVEAARALG
jgi:DNA polymerase-3 subunit delta'